MRLDLTRAFVTEGYQASVDHTADISECGMMWGRSSVGDPVKVTGELFNKAGVLHLHLGAEYILRGECDRCCRPVVMTRTANASVILVKEKQDDDSDELWLVDGDFFETDGLVAESVMLDLPSKLLCDENCRGLCPMCGQNLNEKKCDCKKQQSPFDILKQDFNG